MASERRQSKERNFMDKKTKLLATATMLLTLPLIACSNGVTPSTSVVPSVDTTSTATPISTPINTSTTPISTPRPISTPTPISSTISSTPTPISSTVITPVKLYTHAEYMAAETDEAIKVAGKAVYAFKNEEKSLYGAFLQDGIGGYYIYDIPSSYTIEVGKNYEVTGAKGYYNGIREVKDITSIVSVDTDYPVTVTDVSDKTLTDAGMTDYHTGYVTLEGKVIAAPTISDTKAYSITVAVGDSSIDLRVDPSYYSSAAELTSFNNLFKTVAANQKLQVKGIMSSFGYSASKLSAQVLLTSVDDVSLLALDDDEICANTAEEIALPYVVEKDASSITLPSELNGVSIAWTSDNEAISSSGTVTHSNNDVTVKLTANLTKGTASAQKVFSIVVLGTSQNETVLAYTGFEDPNPPDEAYGQSTLKGAYKGAAITIDGHEWYLDNALIGNSSSDKKIGTWSCRQKPINANGSTYTLFDVTNLTYVDFYAATYGTKAPASIVVSYSTDSGETWTVAETNIKTAQELQHYRVYLNLNSDKCRVKFEFDAVSGQNQCLDEVNLVSVGA